jgi:hypothetical protein
MTALVAYRNGYFVAVAKIDIGARMMTSSKKARGRNVKMEKRGNKNVAPEAGELLVALTDLDFEFRVSKKARDRIDRNEARAARVFSTSARFAFR